MESSLGDIPDNWEDLDNDTHEEGFVHYFSAVSFKGFSEFDPEEDRKGASYNQPEII